MLIANSDKIRMVQVELRQLVAIDAMVKWHYVMLEVLLAVLALLILLVVLQYNLTQGISLFIDK